MNNNYNLEIKIDNKFTNKNDYIQFTQILAQKSEIIIGFYFRAQIIFTPNFWTMNLII